MEFPKVYKCKSRNVYVNTCELSLIDYINGVIFFLLFFCRSNDNKNTRKEIRLQNFHANQIIVFIIIHVVCRYINQRDTLQNDEYSLVLNSIVKKKHF